MLIHSILAASRANGPGLRAVVWFQGCTLACPGCHNPLTHPTAGAGREVSPEDLAAEIIRTAPAEVEGVTISGGEPLQQAYHLLELLVRIRTRPAWSIGLFSGYYTSELEDGCFQHGEPTVGRLTRSELWYRIRRYLDFAILGRYDARYPNGLDPMPLCSTANQKLWTYTDRYATEDFQTVSEFTISPTGLTQISGFPNL